MIISKDDDDGDDFEDNLEINENTMLYISSLDDKSNNLFRH